MNTLPAMERFELIGQLYYRDTGKLRPGKDAGAMAGYDPNDDEHTKRFQRWRDAQMLESALLYIVRLEMQVAELAQQSDGGQPKQSQVTPGADGPSPTSVSASSSLGVAAAQAGSGDSALANELERLLHTPGSLARNTNGGFDVADFVHRHRKAILAALRSTGGRTREGV